MDLLASSNSTALHFAAVNNRKRIIEILLRSGADPSFPNGKGLLASELCTDSEVRALLSRDLSHMNGITPYAISPINRVRQNMRAHAEAGGSSDNFKSSLENQFNNLSIQGSVTTETSDIKSPDIGDDSEHCVAGDYDNFDDDDDIETQMLREAVLAAAAETAIG